MSFPKIGQEAPAFKLKNQKNEWIDLKSLKGKNIILYFYPKAMTPGCTVQACGLRDKKQSFSQLDTIILGISPDDPMKLEKFIERENLNFDLLSDPEHLVAEKYGVWGLKKFMGREYMGVLRVTFIIDKTGKVVNVLDKVKTKSHHVDILKMIKG